MKVLGILLAVVAVAIATQNNNGTIQVLFLGDSITEGWSDAGKSVYDQYYAPLGTVNYGRAGDRTEDLLRRILNGEMTDGLSSAKICVINIGTMNIPNNTDNDIAMGVVFNLLELRERAPQMKVLVLGILPRTNANVTQRTGNINAVLQRLDNGRTIRFLDMKEHFYLGDGRLAEELYNADLFHLASAGYQKWAEVMAPLFNEMLTS